LMVQRPARGIWAGLWCLPMWDTEADLRAALAQQEGLEEAVSLHRLPAVQHALTHLDWALHPMRWERAPDGVQAMVEGARWLGLSQALSLGLPAPIRRLLEDGVP
jgi:A/G-specific adenine glycosylase